MNVVIEKRGEMYNITVMVEVHKHQFIKHSEYLATYRTIDAEYAVKSNLQADRHPQGRQGGVRSN